MSEKWTTLAPPRLRLDEVTSTSGQYPWDTWKDWAISAGLPRDLATLARALIREAYNHGWDSSLRELCGWADDGLLLFELGMKHPIFAQQAWIRLLETDGTADGARWT